MTKLRAKGIRLVLGVLLLMVGLTQARADERTVYGRVASFDRETLAVQTSMGKTVSFSLTADTKYVKWITRKPLQRSTVADWSFLQVGKRVGVEQEAGEQRGRARLVYIATE